MNNITVQAARGVTTRRVCRLEMLGQAQFGVFEDYGFVPCRWRITIVGNWSGVKQAKDMPARRIRIRDGVSGHEGDDDK